MKSRFLLLSFLIFCLSVLNSGTIGTLNGRLCKAETALANERQRYAELEDQLQEQSKSQESIAIMKARLKQVIKT